MSLISQLGMMIIEIILITSLHTHLDSNGQLTYGFEVMGAPLLLL